MLSRPSGGSDIGVSSDQFARSARTNAASATASPPRTTTPSGKLTLKRADDTVATTGATGAGVCTSTNRGFTDTRYRGRGRREWPRLRVSPRPLHPVDERRRVQTRPSRELGLRQPARLVFLHHFRPTLPLSRRRTLRSLGCSAPNHLRLGLFHPPRLPAPPSPTYVVPGQSPTDAKLEPIKKEDPNTLLNMFGS